MMLGCKGLMLHFFMWYVGNSINKDYLMTLSVSPLTHAQNLSQSVLF